MITKEYLKSVAHYNPVSGDMFWKERPEWHFKNNGACRSWNTKYAGNKMETLDGKGYKVVSINKKRYLVHRLVWLYVHGRWPNIIDHKNGIRTDNRLSNLRDVSMSENHKNRSISKNNTSGVTGVYLNKSRGLWCAQMKHGGKTYHLGSSVFFEEAVALRKAEERRLGFSKRHGVDKNA